MKDLSFIRFFLAILLLLVPPALEFPVIHRHITPGALTLCVITALIITLLASLGGRLVSVKCISEISFIRRHRIECMMAGFMIYFWTFSLMVGTSPSLRRNIRHSTMRMLGITFLHAMTVVWFYHNRTGAGVGSLL